ncbi:sensor histidine kinase [Streptomyces sp. NPDC051217]|uniref:sensor histidine kinase n=1 Tax=Streptomyces sp. NPDC051217 TaxID=3365644 RepID=UPI0037B0130A
MRWSLRGWVSLTVFFLLFLLLVMPWPEALGLAVAIGSLSALAPLLVWAGRQRLGRRPRAAAPFPRLRFTEQLVAVREQERHRIRRDLHDGLGPSLAGLRLRLDTAAGAVHESSARRLILDAADEASRTMDDVRRIIDDLRPPDLDEVGLPSALRNLVDRVGTETTLRVDCRVPEPGTYLRPGYTTELAAYRIASEALTNVIRHAVAGTVTVSLDVHGDHLVLQVLDDGIGLPPGHATGRRRVGLNSMAQRAEEVGGRCLLLPHPRGPSGTLVHVLLPRNPM